MVLDLIKDPRFAINCICDADYNYRDAKRGDNSVRATITVEDVKKLHERAGD